MGISDSIRPFRAFSGNGRYVCVSYAHRDSQPVYDILERLYTDGYNIWYDEGRPAGDTTEIEGNMAASGCDIFLIFISPSSVKGGSEPMIQLERARKLKKPIVYATIDCLKMPDGMESYFQGNKMITGDANEVTESLRGAIPKECRGAARREPARFDLNDETFGAGRRNAGSGLGSPDSELEEMPVALLDDDPDSAPVIPPEYEPAQPDEYESLEDKPDVQDPQEGQNTRDGQDSQDGQVVPEPRAVGGDDCFEYVFSGDSGLTLVKYTGSDTDLVIDELRDGYPVTRIGDQAFKGCDKLRSIVLPSSVTLIGHTAFRDCRSLTDIMLPCGVTTIGAGAFYGCSSLAKLTIPDAVTVIGDMAFRGCLMLSRVTIPDSVKVISDDAFAECMLLIIECLENSYAHWYATHNNIPFRLIPEDKMYDRIRPLYGDKPYEPTTRSERTGPGKQRGTDIAPSWEMLSESLSDGKNSRRGAFSPVLEPSTDKFAYFCFADEDYPQLKSLICDMLKDGFDLCRCPDPKQGSTVKDITEVYIRKCRTFVLFLSHNTVQSGRVMDAELDFALKYTRNRFLTIRMDDAAIPDMLPQYGGGNIINSMLLSSDELRKALTAHLAGSGCGRENAVSKNNTRFVSNDFEFTVKNSGAIITRYLGSGKKVEIPAKLNGYGVIALDNRVFDGNTSVTEITIPSTVTELGVELFKGCTNLQRVILPNALTKIGYGTFRGCERLKEINLPSTVTEIGWHAFAGCSSLSAMAIPIRVTKIENWAFDGCLSLGRISIPDHVTKIDVNAFFNCSKRLTILSTKGSYAQKFAITNGYKWKRVR